MNHNTDKLISYWFYIRDSVLSSANRKVERHTAMQVREHIYESVFVGVTATNDIRAILDEGDSCVTSL